MDHSIIEIQSEYEKLIEEIHRLKSRIVSLTALRDDLLYHVCPALEAEYEEKIAGLERELMAAYLYLNTYRRTIELLQAQINSRRKKVSVEEAEAQAQEEFRQAQEDINKKAEEAKKAREEWKGGSNWSEYDKAAREQQKEESSDDSAGPEENDGFDKTEEEKDRGTRRESDEEEWERMGREEEECDSGETHERNDWDKQDDDYSRDEDQAGRQEGGNGSEDKDESVATKIKRLYRKIVKRLHPDVRPNPTDREKELLNKAHEAYKKGDLDALGKIWEELSGTDAPEDEFKDSPEDIARIREVIKKLQGLCNELIREIQKIKGEFPYTMKAFLEDEEAVAEKRFMLSGELSDVREMCSKLVDEIERLRWELAQGE